MQRQLRDLTARHQFEDALLAAEEMRATVTEALVPVPKSYLPILTLGVSPSSSYR